MNSNLRQRRSTGASGSASSSSGTTSKARANTGGMWRFYTDDSPGIKIGPVPVLIISLVFISCVFMLHIWSKYTRSSSSHRESIVIQVPAREFVRAKFNRIMLSRYHPSRWSVGRVVSPTKPKSSSATSLAASLAVLVIVATVVNQVGCLEPDAAIINPLVDLTKGFINTITKGEPLSINFGASDVAKNFASFTWRTGWPVTMPSGFIEKTQNFYNNITTRVAQTDVKNVERKTLAALKVDLDNIVDSIHDQVRQSPDGLYTNYLDTKVNGVPLEDACTAIGVQLKAYGVDLTNYRNIAGMVLGVPIMPTVASGVMSVADLGSQVTGTAMNSMGAIRGTAMNSIGSIANNTPLGYIPGIGLLNRQQPQPVAGQPEQVFA